MSRDYQNQDNITKFEFLLSLEGHIVCQRFFNVRDHVDQARRSLDLHYYIKNICEDFMEDLKIKSSNYVRIKTISFIRRLWMSRQFQKKNIF